MAGTTCVAAYKSAPVTDGPKKYRLPFYRPSASVDTANSFLLGALFWRFSMGAGSALDTLSGAIPLITWWEEETVPPLCVTSGAGSCQKPRNRFAEMSKKPTYTKRYRSS
ncbi:hypothetical protein CEXT_437851 [Caerostris extrusa]|uniref:Uncharacterized protein n=1 Tax=Caerostris extrusa TaxID=172846 RepID=A0AAV4YDR8_CAEEX|nr:hypothetical protein CEXT_437851 [Caerostris extrusa]